MFSSPNQNVAQLNLKEGMVVADFGAGTGAYSKAASLLVGNTGKIYAIEVQKDLVKKLESDLKFWSGSNIECIWGDIEKLRGTKIADHSVDAVIVANVLFQVPDRIGLIDEARRILKRNGKVLLVEGSASLAGIGPDPSRSIDKKQAEELFTKRGFKLLENISTNNYHYGIIFIHE